MPDICGECLIEEIQASPTDDNELRQTKFGVSYFVQFLDGSAFIGCTMKSEHEHLHPDAKHLKVILGCVSRETRRYRGLKCFYCKTEKGNCANAISFSYGYVPFEKTKDIQSRVVDPNTFYHKHHRFDMHPVNRKHHRSKDKPFYTFEEWEKKGKPIPKNC